MTDVVPVRLVVAGRTIAAGATRSGLWWSLKAASFPGYEAVDKDLARARLQLEKKLLPEVQRLPLQSTPR